MNPRPMSPLPTRPPADEAPPSEPMDLVEAEPVAPQSPAPAPEPEPEPESAPVSYATTLKDLFARMDAGWAQFRVAASAWPSERMDERIEEDGWSRKQMLAAHHRLARCHPRSAGQMILSGHS